jgi:hypothetical protein
VSDAQHLPTDSADASGIIETIVRHHLSLYEEDFEAWRKL